MGIDPPENHHDNQWDHDDHIPPAMIPAPTTKPSSTNSPQSTNHIKKTPIFFTLYVKFSRVKKSKLKGISHFIIRECNC